MSHVVEFARELVRIPSVLGGEGPVAGTVAARMTALGFDKVEIDGAGNAIGTITGAPDGPTIILDGHIDTVDVLPRDAWTHDPFGGEIINGRLYGRGASDMKGAVAAMIHAAAGMDRSKLRGRIVVSASVGEEWLEGPALKTVMDAYPPDFVVIGESTELNLVHAGRGRAEFVLTTRGKPAHASTPHLGENAVHKMMAVVREIESLPMRIGPVIGRGVMALTDIISEPYPAHSVVPSGCHATYERRLLPGESRDAVLDELRRACTRAGAPDTDVRLAVADYTTYTGVRWRQEKWFPAWYFAPESGFVVTALDALHAAGVPARLAAYQFCTNAAYCAGVAGVPTLGFGPGAERLAHIVDEYVEVKQLESAVRGYAAILAALMVIP